MSPAATATRLFLDTRFVKAQTGLEHVLGPCGGDYRKPLTIDGSTGWTQNHLLFCWYLDPATGEFRGWRSCGLPANAASDPKSPSVQWVLEPVQMFFPVRSRDGLAWETCGEPALMPFINRAEKHPLKRWQYNPGYGLVEMTVICDEREADPARRFKALYRGHAFCDDAGRVRIPQDVPEFGEAVRRGEQPIKGYFCACSPDGARWPEHNAIALIRGPSWEGYRIGSPDWIGGDGFAALVYDEARAKYAVYLRTNISRPGRRRERGISRLESADCRTWENHELVMRADVDWQMAMGRRKHDFYYNQVWLCGGAYLGIVDMYYWDDDCMHLELAWSPDTVHWERICPGTDLVPHGRTGEYGGGCNAVSYLPRLMGDDVWVYYGGGNGPHGNGDRNTSSLLLARFKRDRFAGLRPKCDVGELTTAPITVGALGLTLNADARSGAIRAALRDEAGQEIPGFGLAESDAITTDALEAPLTWRGRSATGLAGKPARLRLVFQRATVYALTTQPQIPYGEGHDIA